MVYVKKSDKIPDNAQKGIEACAELAEKMFDAGMKHENVYLDPLVPTVATQQDAGKVVYDTIIGLKKEVPYAGILCGLSNVGFGLPKRKLINRTFLAILGIAGLDGAIIDPLDKELMLTLVTTKMLAGKDKRCRQFLKAVK